MPRRLSLISSLLVLATVSVAGIAAAERSPTAVDAATVQRWFDGWKAPTPPRRLVANIHYVGAVGVSAFLVTTPQGHILLDTGFEDTVPVILRSVEELGFRLSDVKIMLSSHAHIDHVGGHALMKQLTGARVIASAADARTLESGGADDFTALPQEVMRFTPVAVDQIIDHGETVTLGGVMLTAHLTPGHTRGSTTWTMDVMDDGVVRHVVFFSSTSINPGTHFLPEPSYPGILADYEMTFARLDALPCDIFFAPHGGQFAMAAKFARLDQGAASNPFIDPEGWRELLASAEKAFRDQLAAEQGRSAAN